MKDFYLHLSSNDSIKYYPENRASNFTIHLPEEIKLEGNWLCALTEIVLPTPKYIDIIICCDAVQHGFVIDKKIPLLRRLLKRGKYNEFINRFYIPVISRTLNSINIYVLDKEGKELSFDSGRLSCTLHFILEE
jgi:hypothetical protein